LFDIRTIIRDKMIKKISPQAIVALEKALSVIYWYKDDLKRYLYQAIDHAEILSVINWSEPKRNIVARVISMLEKNGEKTYDTLLQLILDVSTFDDFTHLIALENGKEKVRQAKDAVAALRKHTSGHVNIQQETEFIKQRREQLQKQTSELNRVKQSIEQLKEIFYNLASTKDFQARGYALEKLLNDLFLLYDLAPKSSFKITGEQIDGTFTFNNDEYLLEAKWRNELTAIDDLDAFSGKLQRKLDNTLGLFISINGFSPDAISAFSSGRKLMFLMDGTDIMAILDERISLPDLLRQKKRAAAHTGNIYLRYQDMISK
jgi:hypothetical protein